MDFLKKVLFGGLIALCMGVTMTSCSSDDDNEEYETTAGAPYTGIYQVTYMTTNEDGSVISSPVTTDMLNMHMTLETDNMGNNTCKYYSDNYDEDGVYYYEGTWAYNDAQKTLTLSFLGHGVGVFIVKSWTNNELKTYSESDGYFYEVTWTKVSSVTTRK